MNQRKKGNAPDKTVIIGVGNVLLKDDGLGIHLLERLKKTRADSLNLELIDAGITADISVFVNKADKVIILDAVRRNSAPGTVYRFELKELDESRKATSSWHRMSLLDSLKALETTNEKPESVTIIGIEPKLIDWGTELSPEIEASMPHALKLIQAEIEA